MLHFIRAFARDSSGSPATEYAILASLIAVVLIGSFAALSGGITGLYNLVFSSL